MATGINLNGMTMSEALIDYSDPVDLGPEPIIIDGIEFSRDEVLTAKGIAHNYQHLYDEALWFYEDMGDEESWVWDQLEILCQGYNEFVNDSDDMDGSLAGMTEIEIQLLLNQLDAVTIAQYKAQDTLNQM